MGINRVQDLIDSNSRTVGTSTLDWCTFATPMKPNQLHSDVRDCRLETMHLHCNHGLKINSMVNVCIVDFLVGGFNPFEQHWSVKLEIFPK